MHRRLALFIVLLHQCVGCGSSDPTNAPPATNPDPDAAVVTSPDAAADTYVPVHVDDAALPEAGPVVVEPPPDTLPWPSAKAMTDVGAIPNRDSAIVTVPVVDGAQDYRVFMVPTSLDVTADGGETPKGTTIFCAGFRQHNAPASAREVLRQIEVTGLTAATKLVVEAIDAPCPFPGVMGAVHAEVPIDSSKYAEVGIESFPIVTGAEIEKRYGSRIVNGQGAATKLGQPAAPNAPHVLARATVTVTPLGYGKAPTATFFDDFSATDAPTFVGKVSDAGRSQQGRHWRNEKWLFYSYGANVGDAGAQFFLDRGQLHMVITDWAQEIFGSNVAYPRRPVQLSSTDYLHVTFEVASDATQRRYWWIGLCGAATKGATISADGQLLGNIVQTPFFMAEDGRNPSVEGWNCLQVFPRDGTPFGAPPTGKSPESEVRVMLNKPGDLGRASVVNLSPPFTSPSVAQPSWYRERDATGKLVAPMLDDQLLMAPRTKFDLYVRRDRVVLYANGRQKLCSDFPTHPLTMAEGALGFGHVLYHSSAERSEFAASYWDRRGQKHYLENTPFVDERHWDNVGYEENVSMPPGFDDKPCWVKK